MDNQILQSLLELLKSTGSRRKEEEPCRICETRDLVKNGGFEGVTHEHREAFKNWMQETHGSIVGVSNIPYEGELAARLISRDSKNPDSKKARLFQNIAVTPGCRYELSFAENFFIYSMKSYSKARLSARVFYGDPDHDAKQVDLVNLVIYKPCAATASNKGYSFHRKAFDTPVPENVHSLTVEFLFEIKDMGGTEWKIDSVSVHSIAAAAAQDS
jgi:hypothetical protein